MKQGINEAIPYVEIQAERAKAGMATYATPSDGREPTGGLFVLWDRDTGFTGTGWYNAGSSKADTSSPAYNYTDEDIQNMIESSGSLNTLFQNWITAVPNYQDRYEFILYTLPDACVEG